MSGVPDDPRGGELPVSEAIHRRRSIRRFDRSRPVPRELVLRCLDAARYAPSSCNLQTWDFVWVEDEERRRALALQTRSVLIAPVTIFVLYDRELAREGQANVQSASAAIMTLLLQATSLGLASLWVNALGDRDEVRRLLGAPDDFEALALVCLGWPADPAAPPAPERRPLEEVVHRDQYRGAGGLPKSPDPDRWSLDELALYFKRKLQSGTRYNKPDPAVHEPLTAALFSLLPPPPGAGTRLLDLCPGTGLYTEALHRRLPDAELAVMEISAVNHFFAARRAGANVGFVPFPAARAAEIYATCAPPGTKVTLQRESGGLPVMPHVLPAPPRAGGPFDVATAIFRLEGLPAVLRPVLLAEAAALLAPGGRLLVAYTSRRSWHGPAYALRRRLSRDSVEYPPVPDPNVIGPYEPLAPRAVRRLLAGAGLVLEREVRLLPLPDVARLRPRLQRAGGPARLLGGVLGPLVLVLRPFERLLAPFARIRIACARRP